MNPERCSLLLADDAKKGSKKSSPPSGGKTYDGSVPAAADLSEIHLEGEDNEEVPIFDTCDDIRKKLNEALKNTSQAKLSRELSELLPNSSVSSRQLSSFLKFKGRQAGAHSIAFYAAYVYFEKIRIKQDKKKTAKREEMEKKWREPTREGSWHSSGSKLGGFPRTGQHNARLTVPQGVKWRLDQYGEIQEWGEPTTGAIVRKKPGKK